MEYDGVESGIGGTTDRLTPRHCNGSNKWVEERNMKQLS